MNLRRVFRHLLTPDWIVSRVFPRAALKRFENAVRISEVSHRGELRVAIEAGIGLLPLLRGATARARALDAFARLRVWDTEENSGVLIFLQLVDREIEIIADRGISAKVGQAQWDAICHRMEEAFRARRFEVGVLEGIAEITTLLRAHFPARSENPDELPDRPIIL